MSKKGKEQVIKVDKLVIHAKEVKIIEDRDRDRDDHRHERRRDPWGLFWGRRPVEDDTDHKDD